jgi:phosphoglycerate dehydrogenase-like enzyme
MQILMTEAALRRTGERLAMIAPDAQVVTISAEDEYQSGGQPFAEADLAPEVVWLSLDSWTSGSLPKLYGRIMKSPAARWTQIMAAGIDNPMFKNILEKGVRITKSSAQAIPIAEYVVGHGISLQLPIRAQAEAQARHEWARTPYTELGHTRWVLSGYGSIGKEIAKRIKPFGVHLTVVRRNPAPDATADAVVGLDQFRDACAEADVVALACALNDDTRHMCDAAFFEALKSGAILINIGRGGLIDEAALKAGLDRDQPAHAVLDVFETEPLPADSWFWDHPKVRVSAHTSNSGDGNLARGDELFLDNLARYLAKQPLRNEADPSEVGLPAREPA